MVPRTAEFYGLTEKNVEGLNGFEGCVAHAWQLLENAIQCERQGLNKRMEHFLNRACRFEMYAFGVLKFTPMKVSVV